MYLKRWLVFKIDLEVANKVKIGVTFGLLWSNLAYFSNVFSGKFPLNYGNFFFRTQKYTFSSVTIQNFTSFEAIELSISSF